MTESIFGWGRNVVNQTKVPVKRGRMPVHDLLTISGRTVCSSADGYGARTRRIGTRQTIENILEWQFGVFTAGFAAVLRWHNPPAVKRPVERLLLSRLKR